MSDLFEQDYIIGETNTVHKLRFLMFTLLLIIVSSTMCTITGNKEENAYKETCMENTIICYEKFIRSYPQSKYIPNATESINFLLNERNPAFRKAQKAKVIIDESFSSTFNSYSSEITKIITPFLYHAGIIVKEEEYDIIVKITIKGTPLTANYKRSDNHMVYSLQSGARIDGMIIFENMSRERINTKFSHETETPNSTQSDFQNAPYSITIDRYLDKDFAEIIVQVFGISSLINSLKEADPAISVSARKILEKIQPQYLHSESAKNAVPGFIVCLQNKEFNVRMTATYFLAMTKDPRAVEPLISSLKDKRKEVRENAANALKHITNANFGEDQAQWKAWYKKNKNQFSR